MSAAVTPWFDGDAKPEYVGVYERRFSWICGIKYALWNGHYWCSFTTVLDDAMTKSHLESQFQHGPWRGLASDPKASNT
jgi:hypothetical protein